MRRMVDEAGDTRTMQERVAEVLGGDCQVGELMTLHARLKLLLMAHSPVILRALGRIVAAAQHADRAAVVDAYRSTVLLALETPTTRGRHVNALQHMAGYFKNAPAGDRQALADGIAAYERGDVTLATPLSVVRAQARRHGVAYLLQQLYLEAA